MTGIVVHDLKTSGKRAIVYKRKGTPGRYIITITKGDMINAMLVTPDKGCIIAKIDRDTLKRALTSKADDKLCEELIEIIEESRLSEGDLNEFVDAKTVQ